MSYQTIQVKFEASSAGKEQDLCFIQIHRPEANNTINDLLIDECQAVLNTYRDQIKIVVLEGLPEVFCFGADFNALADHSTRNQVDRGPAPLYDLWRDLATGPFISVAHVRGKANAGGIGFVAACDLVLADAEAEFSLSELLFGLMPACVLPFLIKRMGFQRAHAMTLMTKPVAVKEAYEWSLVDAYADNSQSLLRQNLLRLRRLNKKAIQRYKTYMHSLDDSLERAKQKALDANREVFSDQENLGKIEHYVKTGQFPWEV